MIFKCKMCGGALDVAVGASIAECPYCGAKQTLPKLDDEKRANLYDRAGHFRRMSDFDKAMALYEEILREDGTDAEAYWSIVLCRYGIEYVEDPATHRRIPTVNRAQLTSILADEDYKAALTYADGHQRELYEAEAKEIENIQKGILAISEREAPFDVFICYKETDERGVRTRDSVLANDLYYELTNEGYKVFFSRITLEDKLGTAYEPYIFAALRSAPVMVVVGTKPEYLNAPWVKNEWSRYLALIRGGAKKTLIPAYRDMDPYDLPDAFSHLQAQDMSKLGFMQDLLRGIKKLLAASREKTAPAAATPDPTALAISAGATPAVQSLQSLIKRAWLFLEDGDFTSVDAYCEKVLDTDPEYSEAYFLKLLAQTGSRSIRQFLRCPYPIADNPNFIKAVRFATPKQRDALNSYVEAIDNRIAASRAAEEAKKRRERRRNRIVLLSVLAVILVTILIFSIVNACGPIKAEGITYKRQDGGYIVSKVDKDLTGSCTIDYLVNGKPVTAIADAAFENITGITSVTIPETVVKIGESAFAGCTGLTTVTIRYNVRDGAERTIGANAFFGCTNLTSIEIPATFTSIAERAFSNCTALESVIFGSDMKNISAYAFNGCNRLTRATFRNTSGWYTTRYGTDYVSDLNVTNSSTNAELLRSTYAGYYWQRS